MSLFQPRQGFLWGKLILNVASHRAFEVGKRCHLGSNFAFKFISNEVNLAGPGEQEITKFL
jgi:hypothetical protein